MNIFEEVKSQLNIKQVIEHYGIEVNRAHRFVCPFHNDHTPSASIKNDYFNCFVCGTGGDLISFTAKYLGLSNLDAAKELVKEFNLNVDISTKEERREQYLEAKKRKKEITACNSLREKFAKDKEIRSAYKKNINYRLRGDRKQAEQRKAQEQEQYIQYAGNVLADVHRYLWQGVNDYPIDHERHIIGAQELAACEYYLECYDDHPATFCELNRGVIESYERKLRLWAQRVSERNNF